MNLKTAPGRRPYFKYVLIISTVIAVWLGKTTYYINFWPTDSYYFYIPTAANLFSLPHFSDMHHIPDPKSIGRVNMHGKETLILAIAVMQKILNDEVSLFPNVLVLIIAIYLSSICIFLILKEIFNEQTAFIGFLLFSGCFWPYMYMLQGAHQPLALMFFLLTVLCLQQARRYPSFYFAGGICGGFLFFSSPTALIYTPYFLLYFFTGNPLQRRWPKKKKLVKILMSFLIGTGAVIFLFTWPDPAKVIHDFIQFVTTSQHFNHFNNYRHYISEYLPEPFTFDLPRPITFRGAGWVWIFKYFFLIMPVMFAFFLFSVVYLFKLSFQQRSLFVLLLICCSTPLAVETAQVCQFGRNYFSWLPGIIFLLAYTVFLIEATQKNRALLNRIIAVGISAHILFNAWLFTTDVLPYRMFSNTVYQWLIRHKIKDLLVYTDHLNHPYTVSILNNPKYKERINFHGIKTIIQPVYGFILIPPASGKTIWKDCAEEDFTGDPFWNELYASPRFHQYTVASFKTLASSRIWLQEEEICTYLDLAKGKISPEDLRKTQLHILDARQLQKEWFPSRE